MMGMINCAAAIISVFALTAAYGLQPLTDSSISPYPPLSGKEVSARIPHSPDPISGFRWDNPAPDDGLETYTLGPVSYRVNRPSNVKEAGGSVWEITGPCDIMFDFGQVNAGWFEFDSAGIAGDVEMSISEFNEPAVFNFGSQHPVKTAKPVRHGDIWRLELNDQLYEGVRYAWIHIRSLDSPARISAPRLVCQTKPVNYNGSFSCSDTLLTRIWYTGAYTVKLNLLEDHFGAILMERSDRHSWTGDAHTSQAASMVAFGNFDFVKKNLIYTSTQYNGIASYSLYWVQSLIDYYNYTGDTAFLREMLDNACSKLDTAYGHYDSIDNISFYGWDERLGGGFENPNTDESLNAYRMLCIGSWNRFADAVEHFGKPDLARKYRRYAGEKTAALKSDRDWWRTLGLHASADAVNASLASDDEAEEIWGNAFSDRMQRLSYSPFNQYFILNAMSRLDRRAEALTTVDDCWGGQLRYGATTFFEVFRPSWNDISAPNDAPVNNQCGYTSLTHPWSAGVTKWLTEEILGVKPSRPGFARFEVKPYVSSRVRRVAGDVPTPKGVISFSLDTESGELALTVPEGSEAVLAIPKAGRVIRKVRLASGRKLTASSEDDTHIYFDGLGPGVYRGKVIYRGEWPRIEEEPFRYPMTEVAEDTVTRGDWIGKYGSKGRLLFNTPDDAQLPVYVRDVKLGKALKMQWCGDTDDCRALQRAGGGRGLGIIYTGDPNVCMQSMTIDIGLQEGERSDVSLYFVDFDRKGRRTAIELFDLDTKEILMPVHMVRDYEDGKYVTFKLDGPVRIRIDQVRGPNALCAGLFFD